MYILNGFSPFPQIEHKIKPQSKDPINGSDLVSTSLGNFGTSARRFKEFKCFFAVQDPRYATPSRKTHPNWKVERFLRHAMLISKEAVIPGECCSVDKQTIGFQGRHEDVRRHDEKQVGDGFQCDSLNTGGVTLTAGSSEISQLQRSISKRASVHFTVE